jgi:hypothetical protein
MKMKNLKRLQLSFIPLFFLTTCHFSNFYPDPDDKGLSRFTSHGYNVATGYINDKSFLNTGPFYPLLHKDSTGNLTDTLVFSWEFFRTDTFRTASAYRQISFLLPVQQSFSKSSLLAMNGQRLTRIPVTLQDTSLKRIDGMSTLYFVSVSEVLYPQDVKYLKLSGLFDGNIGDSVMVTKGRFDFEVDERTLNF